MKKRLRPVLTYANVTATLALCLALGGGAAYAAQLGKNSVGPKQLRKNAVTGPKVKDGSLLAQDFRPGQLPAGARDPQGIAGAPGATDVVVRYGEEGKPKEGEEGQSNARCLPGETLTGGGFDFFDDEPAEFAYTLEADRPSVEPEPFVYPAPGDAAAASGWFVAMQNESSGTFYFRTYALCARP